METTQKKRPVGMTILLVLSFINACWNIFSSSISLIMKPGLTEMRNNGQLEEMMKPFSAMGGDFAKAMNDAMQIFSQIDSKFYLILIVLFIASLIGVIKMFKGNKLGFHIYSIAQICMLIDNSVFVYPLQKPSPFFSDLMLTAIIILLYYLYFKRLEMSQPTQKPE
ncbi:MAG: hypothetical protein J6P83_07750 [Bacteroidales bacterium]|nr:hypothetical protein [Bacteroidales bacterium]